MKTSKRTRILMFFAAIGCCALLSCSSLKFSFWDMAAMSAEDIVELRQAPLPPPIGMFSVHCWFVVFDGEGREGSRWEVWQERNVGGTSWGFVHKGLLHPDSGVGGGEYELCYEWRGSAAREIISLLNRPTDYPFWNTYLVWPGPNSNTYVAWILDRVKSPVELPPHAIGKDYLGALGLES